MPSEQNTPAGPLSRAMSWWDQVRGRWQRDISLLQLGDAETDRMAQELGLTAGEFMRLAASPGGQTNLLELRLAALGLKPDDVRAISPLLLRDLERTCARCDQKDRCASDMAVSGEQPGWESYCPNSGTLKSLR